PEVLRGQPYTLASDIYSFSMILWEFISGISPFDNEAHDFQLSLDICKGKRPEINKNIPQCYINLTKKCWDIDPPYQSKQQNLTTATDNGIHFAVWKIHNLIPSPDLIDPTI
ncbi:19199_t:CDS:2, partial [Funneliformis geosporum]